MTSRLLAIASLVTFTAIGCAEAPTSPRATAASFVNGAPEARPPRDQPATAVFQCPGAACVTLDRILGDGPDAVYGYTDGARLTSTSDFVLSPTGARTIFLDFRDGPPPCSGCRRTFDTLTVGDPEDTYFHPSVIDPATGNEVGVTAIPIGQTWSSRLKLAFNLPDANGNMVNWAVRFNPDYNSGSTLLHVTRVNDNTWIIEATAEDRAVLISAQSVKKGRCCVSIDEGLYVMPFRLTVQAQ